MWDNETFPRRHTTFLSYHCELKIRKNHEFKDTWTWKTHVFKMIDVFRSLKTLTRLKSHVTIDSSIFRLHYTVSVAFMLGFSIIVTTRQYVGNPIDCVFTKDIPEDVLNTYCWIHSTYTIPSAFWKRIGIDVAHPGIDKTLNPDERRYVTYYQWVCFCLFFQVR